MSWPRRCPCGENKRSSGACYRTNARMHRELRTGVEEFEAAVPSLRGQSSSVLTSPQSKERIVDHYAEN
ncbi:hypothetical protein EYF80_001132 [Liparis tanakae]|uniref:Uncharacterized protein n=1 Tax=Liparis tanakae TaxID=230148 RepID=A0A4Z2JF46_9TELE|nr:hypothetical protein EYF80_001132 [Liparis tanakae]